MKIKKKQKRTKYYLINVFYAHKDGNTGYLNTYAKIKGSGRTVPALSSLLNDFKKNNPQFVEALITSVQETASIPKDTKWSD